MKSDLYRGRDWTGSQSQIQLQYVGFFHLAWLHEVPRPWNVGLLRFSLPMWRGTATIQRLTKRHPQPPCACIALWSRSRSPPTADTFSAAQATALLLSFPASSRAFAAQ